MARRTLDDLLDQQDEEEVDAEDSHAELILALLERFRGRLRRELAAILANLPPDATIGARDLYRGSEFRELMERWLEEVGRAMVDANREARAQARRQARRHHVAIHTQQATRRRDRARLPQLRVAVAQAIADDDTLADIWPEAWGDRLRSRAQVELAASARRGDDWRRVRELLTDFERSVASAARSEAELVVRTGYNAAYNDAHQRAIEAAEAILDRDDDGNLTPEATGDPLMVQAREYLDKRNHPISRVLDRQTRTIDGEFTAPLADIMREARAMGRGPGLGAIYWPRVGAAYVGKTYPVHRYERGRIVPWRASWATDT